MAEIDWASLTGTALLTADVNRGVTAAFTRPTGGGTFCFGYRSVSSATGFAGYYVNLTNFNPIAGSRKGGSVRAAMKRYASGVSYAPMIGLLVGTDPSTAEGYMLGLTEATSYQIGLKKGSPASGLDPSGSDILRLSTSSYTGVGDSVGNWLHLRLDVLVNPHEEVVLNVYRNTGNVTSPTWAAITGMDSFIDDSVGILTGSLPHHTGFYAFFGHYTENLSGAVSLFDHIEAFRQTAP